MPHNSLILGASGRLVGKPEVIRLLPHRPSSARNLTTLAEHPPGATTGSFPACLLLAHDSCENTVLPFNFTRIRMDTTSPSAEKLQVRCCIAGRRSSRDYAGVPACAGGSRCRRSWTAASITRAAAADTQVEIPEPDSRAHRGDRFPPRAREDARPAQMSVSPPERGPGNIRFTFRINRATVGCRRVEAARRTGDRSAVDPTVPQP